MQNSSLSQNPGLPPEVPIKTKVTIAHYRKAAEIIRQRILDHKKWSPNNSSQIADIRYFIISTIKNRSYEEDCSLLHNLLSVSIRLFEVTELRDHGIPFNPPQWDYSVHINFFKAFTSILEKGFKDHYPNNFPLELYTDRSIQLKILKLMIEEAKKVMKHRGISSTT